MKKFFIAMAVILMLTACEKEQLIDETETTKQTDFMTVQTDETTTAAVSAVEPSQTTLAGLGESKTEINEMEETEETTAASEQENTEGEEVLLRFLECLQTGEGEPFEYIDPLGAYDFMDDFTLDDYSYAYRGDGIYDVTLTCSDSTADMFPNGDSDWVFKSSYQYYFMPAEREEDYKFSNTAYNPYYRSTDSILNSAYSAAVDFSKFTETYEADGDWFENFDITETHVHRFYHAYNPYFVVYDRETDESYDVTTEEFAAAVKKLYNINMTAEQAQSMTDETGFMRKNCGHGGSWLYDILAGYEETDGEITVRVDYYGDEIYFYPVIESEYTFSKNADGSITLQKVEKIFDRGYGLASGSV